MSKAEPLTDDCLMPFGKHKGTPMRKVPVKYLHWLWINGMEAKIGQDNVADYIAERIDVLSSENDDLIW